MTSIRPLQVPLLRFQAQDAKLRTNKFVATFNDSQMRSVDELRRLFASRYNPISTMPDSFQIWRQDRMFIIIVDMDQVGAEDPMQAADNLISIIESEKELKQRFNNKDDELRVELPCDCDQEHSLLPSFKSFPGEWHDPNNCKSQNLPNVTQISASEVASTIYSPEDTATASPTSQVIFSPSLEIPVQDKPVYSDTASYTPPGSPSRVFFADILRAYATPEPSPATLASATRLAPISSNEEPSRRPCTTVAPVPGPSNTARRPQIGHSKIPRLRK